MPGMNHGNAPSSETLLGESTLTGGLTYQQLLREVLDKALTAEAESVRAAAEVLVRTFNAEGLLYIFGSGHSHMFAEEAFYRAGGAVRVCPVLKPRYMLHEGAVRSTQLERESGHGRRPDGLRPRPGTGLHAGRVELRCERTAREVAQSAKSRGLPVLAITSRSTPTPWPDRGRDSTT